MYEVIKIRHFIYLAILKMTPVRPWYSPVSGHLPGSIRQGNYFAYAQTHHVTKFKQHKMFKMVGCEKQFFYLRF